MWVLVIFFTASTFQAINFSTREACVTAANQVVAMDRSIRAVCVQRD